MSLSSHQPCHIMRKQRVNCHTKILQIVMAPSRLIYPNGLKVAVTVAFVFSITFPLQSVVGTLNSGGGDSNRSWLGQGKMVLGSKPPGCVNKCLGCRPCTAILVVIPSHNRNNFRSTLIHDDEDDDSYYLLSWKCKCGNKFFHP